MEIFYVADNNDTQEYIITKTAKTFNFPFLFLNFICDFIPALYKLLFEAEVLKHAKLKKFLHKGNQSLTETNAVFRFNTIAV